MRVAISEDFMDALSRLNGNEVKKATKTIMSIKKQSNANGLRMHKIEHPCGCIVSFSVNMDIRIIAYNKDDVVTFLYIDHHDDAYHWIANKNVYSGPNNDIRIITARDEEMPLAYQAIIPYSNTKAVKSEISPDMIETLRELQSDEELFDFISEQPEELQEKLFDIALGALKSQSFKISNKFEVRVITDDLILQDALKYPLEKWRIFLHPKQESAINTPVDKSILITGAPGTGKTVCLVHKAKILSEEINEGECILITTFKETLKQYISHMLKALSCDENKVFIVDVSTINQIEENNVTENLDGFFKWYGNSIFYYKKNQKYLIRHILFDEYQDFGKGTIATIKRMVELVPFTISYDYSQSIYKSIVRSAESLISDNTDKFVLRYSYRVNSLILAKLRRLTKLISMLTVENDIKSDITEEEKEIINSTKSAIEGSDIKLLPYNDEDAMYRSLESEYNAFRSTYKANEIIVTRFIPDFYKNLQKSEDFCSELVPVSVRKSYAYLPTLKGKEYKAGIIVFDDIVCQLLNVNRILFNRVDGALKQPHTNIRFYLNLLYVSLSRFRDFITILYPAQYKETITPILQA